MGSFGSIASLSVEGEGCAAADAECAPEVSGEPDEGSVVLFSSADVIGASPTGLSRFSAGEEGVSGSPLD